MFAKTNKNHYLCVFFSNSVEKNDNFFGRMSGLSLVYTPSLSEMALVITSLTLYS